MEIGMIGLGRMGANMGARLTAHGHRVVGYDQSDEALQSAATDGIEPTTSIDALVRALATPRVLWMMVPAGEPVDVTIDALLPLLDATDILIDGGNSWYRDTLRRADTVEARDVRFVDVGVSGGIWGRTEGYALMVGGRDDAVARLRTIFEALAPAADKGWGHVGPSGAGHFVKMVHNGIEYGLMQAYAEGFALMKAKEPFHLDLAQIAGIWQHGSVVRSWLLDLTERALSEDGALDGVAPWVSDSGEGRWTVKEAIDLDVPAPVMTHALIARLESRDEKGFGYRLLAALRNQFGGHAIRKPE